MAMPSLSLSLSLSLCVGRAAFGGLRARDRALRAARGRGRRLGGSQRPTFEISVGVGERFETGVEARTMESVLEKATGHVLESFQRSMGPKSCGIWKLETLELRVRNETHVARLLSDAGGHLARLADRRGLRRLFRALLRGRRCAVLHSGEGPLSAQRGRRRRLDGQSSFERKRPN